MNPTVLLLVKAIALVFILEGILPIVAPAKWRAMMSRIISKEDRKLQFFGSCSMLFGLIVLALLHLFF